MAQKFVAVFLMCMVVLAAMRVEEAEATAEVYKVCYEGCHSACQASGSGSTFCEMKCDTDCGEEEFAAKVEAFKSGFH